MIKTPVRGMRDILPADMVTRSYLLNVIEEVATEAGYQKIETPAIEHLENLSGKDGGENESLIFKILKRGKSLETALENGEELCDSALRYDLTVPLSRFFAANLNELPMPLKALQMGPVWRADAPQKGRFRQFVQCDMDILGDGSILAEVDIIATVVKILSRICREANISGLTVRVNDRRLLLAAAKISGFNEQDYGSALIALDKNDKIGLSGVKDELKSLGFADEVVESFVGLFEKASEGMKISEFCEMLGEDNLAENIVEDLNAIMRSVEILELENAKIVFDPTLVRGMGYYTGPIFECYADGLGSSIAGGGRYDKMIGKFSGGADVPACGFSIGFERLVTILNDAGFTPPNTKVRRAILVGREVSRNMYTEIMNKAEELRGKGEIVAILPMMKNIGRQIELLEKNGYSEFEKIYGD